MEYGAAAIVNHMAVLKNIKNRIIICSINSASGCILKIMESRLSNRCSFTMCVHNSDISNTQNVEAAQVSISGRMDDQTVMYTYIIALKRNDFLTHTITWVNLWTFAKWNKPITKINRLKINESEKNRYEVPKVIKFIET